MIFPTVSKPDRYLIAIETRTLDGSVLNEPVKGLSSRLLIWWKKKLGGGSVVVIYAVCGAKTKTQLLFDRRFINFTARALQLFRSEYLYFALLLFRLSKTTKKLLLANRTKKDVKSQRTQPSAAAETTSPTAKLLLWLWPTLARGSAYTKPLCFRVHFTLINYIPSII